MTRSVTDIAGVSKHLKARGREGRLARPAMSVISEAVEEDNCCCGAGGRGRRWNSDWRRVRHEYRFLRREMSGCYISWVLVEVKEEGGMSERVFEKFPSAHSLSFFNVNCSAIALSITSNVL